MDLLELLAAADVESFNAERGTRRKLEFFAAELDGLDLTGVDLEAVSLEKSDMTGTRLEDASLARANLAGIDGGEMCFRGAIGPRIKLREAWLEDADIGEADFTKGDLKEACLVRTQGTGLVGTGARFVEVDARDARWSGCFLGEASLSGSNFTGADLSRSDLTDASAHGADFTGARLDAVLATRFRATEVNLTGASLVGTRLDHANLAGADLTNANLTGADLRHCNLAGATLTGACLQGVSLVGANLEEVDFSGIDLTGVDLSGMDPVLLGLTEAQIAQATAVGAADLSHAPRRYQDAVAAANASQTCVLWVNVDGDEVEAPVLDPEDEFADPADAPVTPRSVRWTLVGSRGKLQHGVLALDAQGILGSAVLPQDDHFELWLVAKRPGGVQVLRYPLGADGAVGKRSHWPLGYAPVAPPVFRRTDKGVRITGMSSRGPTAIVHQLVEGELTLLSSTRMPTATGVLTSHDAIILNKGGVLTPMDASRPGTPLRAPEGFPGRRATGTLGDEAPVVVWSAAPQPEVDPGGLRWSTLVKRGQPEIERLTNKAGVVSLDAIHTPGGTMLAWVEISLLDGERVFVSTLPDGNPQPLDLGSHVPEVVRFAARPNQAPMLMITTDIQGLIVADPSTGRLVADDHDGASLP